MSERIWMILPMRVRVCAYVCNYGRVREEAIQNVRESKFQGFVLLFLFSLRKVRRRLIVFQSYTIICSHCTERWEQCNTHTLSWMSYFSFFPTNYCTLFGQALKLSQKRPDHATICNIPSGIVYHKCWFGQEHALSKHSAFCQGEQLPRRGKTFAQFSQLIVKHHH